MKIHDMQDGVKYFAAQQEEEMRATIQDLNRNGVSECLDKLYDEEVRKWKQIVTSPAMKKAIQAIEVAVQLKQRKTK